MNNTFEIVYKLLAKFPLIVYFTVFEEEGNRTRTSSTIYYTQTITKYVIVSVIQKRNTRIQLLTTLILMLQIDRILCKQKPFFGNLLACLLTSKKFIESNIIVRTILSKYYLTIPLKLTLGKKKIYLKQLIIINT